MRSFQPLCVDSMVPPGNAQGSIRFESSQASPGRQVTTRGPNCGDEGGIRGKADRLGRLPLPIGRFLDRRTTCSVPRNSTDPIHLTRVDFMGCGGNPRLQTIAKMLDYGDT